MKRDKINFSNQDFDTSFVSDIARLNYKLYSQQSCTQGQMQKVGEKSQTIGLFQWIKIKMMSLF